jgi:hypothetical protein
MKMKQFGVGHSHPFNTSFQIFCLHLFSFKTDSKYACLLKNFKSCTLKEQAVLLHYNFFNREVILSLSIFSILLYAYS